VVTILGTTPARCLARAALPSVISSLGPGARAREGTVCPVGICGFAAVARRITPGAGKIEA